jgi:hypothetical protein
VTSIEELEKELILPMLAHQIEKHKDKVTFPAHIQMKFDGVRCLAYWEDDKVKLISRSGRTWDASPHITKALELVMPKDVILDGELYIHGVPFQTVTKMVSKFREESFDVSYYVYDVPQFGQLKNINWLERYEMLKQLEKVNNAKSIDVVSSLNSMYQRLIWEGSGDVNLSDIFDVDSNETPLQGKFTTNPIVFVDKLTNSEDSIELNETLCLKLVRFAFAIAPEPFPPEIVTIGFEI